MKQNIPVYQCTSGSFLYFNSFTIIKIYTFSSTNIQGYLMNVQFCSSSYYSYYFYIYNLYYAYMYILIVVLVHGPTVGSFRVHMSITFSSIHSRNFYCSTLPHNSIPRRHDGAANGHKHQSTLNTNTNPTHLCLLIKQ